MGAPGPGPPQTGLRSRGGDPDFGTWESMNSKHEITRSETWVYSESALNLRLDFPGKPSRPIYSDIRCGTADRIKILQRSLVPVTAREQLQAETARSD